MKSFVQSIKNYGSIEQIYFFGDFTKEELNKERVKLRSITNNIIDCANDSQFIKKDFTDFILLDHIYRTILQRPEIEQYILVTGDGHFHSVIAYLINFMDKIVGVVGVQGCFSNQLKSSASWWVEIEPKGKELETQRVIETLHHAKTNNINPVFNKTVEHCARIFGLDKIAVASALRTLINDGYVTQVMVEHKQGVAKVLSTDWEAIINSGLWVPKSNDIS